MIILIGAVIVLASVLGGFAMAGGRPILLMQTAEFVVIGGSALGALVIMSPRKVIIDMVTQALACLKGRPYGKAEYEELFKALYELFLVGRRNGMIALEEHVMNPDTSSILRKYPGFLRNQRGVELLCNGLKPVIDGKLKADQLRHLLEIELESLEEEKHRPVEVMSKTADAMPGFGIVAAVLGIVVTMGSINGPIEMIGEHVAAALVGTFLGILLSYGFLNPLAVNMSYNVVADMSYSQCIATSVVGFAGGMAPIMAVEMARRGLASELKPTAEELEEMLKTLNAPGKG